VLPSKAARAQRRRIVKAGYDCAQTLSDAWANFADAKEADQRQAAVALQLPILVAWAMQDRINQFKLSKPTIEKMREAHLSQFQGGHAAFLEQPQQFMAEFLRFASQYRLTEASSPFNKAANA
jgi:4,5:9,10-diseco-3-hydroxy-5,9,17-trioxoandrosta-1(10),2-diene-4-oate hydrolase